LPPFFSSLRAKLEKGDFGGAPIMYSLDMKICTVAAYLSNCWNSIWQMSGLGFTWNKCSFVVLWGLLIINAATPIMAAKRGVLEVRVVDSKTGEPLAARMHLKDQKGKVVKLPKQVQWHDHFVFNHTIKLELPTGNYFFELERGPEYKTITGNFYLDENTVDQKEHKLERFIDMAAEGWYSGDLDIQRSPSDIQLLMQADDLHFAPVTTWANKQAATSSEAAPILFNKSFIYQLLTGRDEREGGGLLFFGLPKPLTLEPTAEFPSSVLYLQQACEQGGVMNVAQKATAWDLPAWIATGQLNAVNILHGELQREGTAAKETGKPKDRLRYGNASGAGRWSQDIYYSLLNCGLRLPPGTGSASGAALNPLGYNRLYVHCEGEPTWEKWWQGFKQGKVVVTNGPLMTPRFNGELPGHVFTAESGKEIEISIALNLATKEKIDYLEIIHNGASAQEVRLDKWAQNNGMLPPLTCKESGWVLVRAVTNNQGTYRYVSSGPVFIEIGYQPRISRQACQFFLDWVVERAKRIKLENAEQRAEVIAFHRTARDYWQALLEKANVD
jgi:hypothetical protein